MRRCVRANDEQIFDYWFLGKNDQTHNIENTRLQIFL